MENIQQVFNALKPTIRRKARKIGLALGGGAARGMAHIGILKVIEEEGIPITLVTGTSAGSIIGALYCGGKSWEEIYAIAKKIRWKDLVKPVIPKMGIVKSEKLEKKIIDLIGDRRIEQLEIPFAATAVNITTGEEVILDKGSTAKAVRASSSIPAIFEPTEIDGKLLIDGGLRNDVPINIALKMGAEYVIGVNLNADRIRKSPPDNIFDVLFYSFNALMDNAHRHQDDRSSILIEPDLSGFNYYDLKNIDDMIELAEIAFRSRLPEIAERCENVSD